jgi:CRISPR system Cascade subunit CasD
LAAALGVDRDEDSTHQGMQEHYGYAVQVESAGFPLRDYHTTQSPVQAALKRMGGAKTRSEELKADKLNTILSTRDYRCDALYIVLVWEKGPERPFSLEDMAQALEEPRFHLYLGRKSCPLALPMQPQVFEAPNLDKARQVLEYPEDSLLSPLSRKDPRGLYWEGGTDEGLEPRFSFQRRDAVLSRRRWQFLAREEHFLPQDQQEEGENCCT